MVEVERSHSGVGSCTSDFFLCCFSSSSRSSSMKMSSSKSILSPGRTREPPTLSLTSSLSRRLRSNGSMKGGQASPMFPTGSGKKKGGSFEPPEPSSPKVTCIGQVRVKSKRRHGRNKLRTNRSQRRGEVSFRKTEQNQEGGGGMHHQQSQSQQECLRHRNQRWVHLPLSICETLRSFGAEFNCFGPCGGRRSSSCSWSNEREKSEKRKRTSSSSNSCGAVFARWLFALEESEEKGKVIEQHEEPVLVRDEVEKRIYREENREVVEMEITEEKLETRGRVEEDEIEEEEEEARESICIPPKNALLLMRSRSAPFRMSSLANRFWDSPAPQDKEEEDFEEDEEEDSEVHNVINGENEEIGEEENIISNVEMKSDLEEEMLESLKEEEMQDAQPKEDEMTEEIKQKEGILRKKFSSEDSLEEAMLEMDEREAKMQVEVVEKKEKRRVSFSSSTMYLEPESEPELEEEEEEEEVDTILEEKSQKSTEDESSASVSVLSEDEKEIPSRSTTDADQDQEDEKINNVKEHEQEDEEEEEEKSLLPDCLLLMMCEPKLSMEVSKETWVCSRDFIRFRHSEKKVVPQKTNGNGGDESTKKRLSTDTNPIPKPPQPSKKQQKQQQKPLPIQIQPARSSCSKVEPLVAAIEKKLTDSRAAYEPFVLKRCKSEPMRNSAKLAPEVCFWNKNKIEANHHHQPPSVGVGATGIGF